MNGEATEQKTILIADDDPAIRNILRLAIEKQGHKVIDVDDGAKAFAAFEEHSPALVLLDVDMPVENGYSACRRIRRSPDGKGIPILMVTGRADIDSVSNAYDAGATDFIAKPINWLIFGHRIQYLLRAGTGLPNKYPCT